jgi:hypothetical protein
MWRKVLTFFTILLIAFLAYFSYKLLREKEVAVNSLIDAVPFDASIIIEINRPEILFDIIHSPPIDAESFLNIPFIRDPIHKLRAIDSIAAQNKIVSSALKRPHSAIISGHNIGKGEIELVYYLKLNNEKEYLPIDRIIRDNIRAKGNISQHNYEKVKINDVSIFNRKSEGFSYAYYSGMVILSKSSILLEEVIRQAQSQTSIRSKAGLETVMKTAGKSSPFNVYINFDFFPILALNFIHSRFKSELEAISRFAHWIELDCNVDDNAIILNGFSSAENTNGFLSDIFKNQEPLTLLLPGLLPSGTESFFALGISDYAKFRINFSDYQRKNLSNPDFDKKLNNYHNLTGIDLSVEFTKIFDEEICFSYYPANSEVLSGNIFTVIKTKGNNEAKQFINQVATEKLFTDSAGVYTLNYNIPNLLFGNIFGLNKNTFCTITDNYIIFGDSIHYLKNFATEFSQFKNLSLDLNYRDLTDLLSEDTYCYFYISPRAEMLYRNYLKYTSDQMLTQYKYGLSQVKAMVYQFGRNNDLFYNNAFIQFAPKRKGNITKQWEVQLENSLSSKIMIVKNHSNQKSEIMCQDKGNNLYLISQDGQILWKRKLNNKILGRVYQADLFRNKKLQYIFNTNDQIVAIDRNGNDVEGFPLKLKNKASGEMAVFDYDKTRNYRFIIPLADKLLYCFDKDGKEVTGWKKPNIGFKPGRIQYFTTNGKDFIVLNDENKIHFLDRKGKERMKSLQSIHIGPNSGIFSSNGKGSFHFECTDSTGTIYLIAPNGNLTKVQTGIYPPDHYYLAADLDFDGVKEQIFFHARKFEAFTNSGARVANYSLNSQVNKQPKIIALSDSTYLFTYTDTTLNRIFLHNNLGETIKDTPLEGSSEITFGNIENSHSLLNLYYCNNNILFCVSVK